MINYVKSRIFRSKKDKKLMPAKDLCMFCWFSNLYCPPNVPSHFNLHTTDCTDFNKKFKPYDTNHLTNHLEH